jgi:alanine racemase
MGKPKSVSRCWIEVDLNALSHNYRYLSQKADKACRVVGIVKSNAYGHGAVIVSKKLQALGCKEFACANLKEALELKNSGIRKPIWLLGSLLKSEIEESIYQKFEITLSSEEEFRLVEAVAKRLKLKAVIHFKIDTGMGRLGCPPEKRGELWHKIQASPWVYCRAIATHYACSDVDSKFTQAQWKNFIKLRPNGLPFHTCNSAALLSPPSPQALGQWVRPGLAMYGISPLEKFQKYLKPLLSWKTRVTLVKTVPRGWTISYGATFKTSRSMKVAVLSVGYADGLFRSLSNKGEVWIKGNRCRILGRVTMDQTMVDVSSISDIKRGDMVTLIGEKISTSSMAEQAGTIPYEITTHITSRVDRIYIGD